MNNELTEKKADIIMLGQEIDRLTEELESFKVGSMRLCIVVGIGFIAVTVLQVVL